VSVSVGKDQPEGCRVMVNVFMAGLYLPCLGSFPHRVPSCTALT
jgi:hypothetical protein